VVEDHEAEEETEGQGRNHEEIYGHDLVLMSGKEGSPRRRRVPRDPAHILGDREGGDFVAEEAELDLNSASAPRWVLAGDAANQRADRDIDRGTTG
jgi:hypothetical protein